MPGSPYEKSTLLPYYHSSGGTEEGSIRPECSPAPVEPPSELRLPPVDPRRSRRYCTDFGFGRRIPVHEDPPPPPPPLMLYQHDDSSSARSTPLATYAETDSDVSSFYEDLDLEFPQPPASPALRRMQSSPLFTLEETNAVREFLRKRWGVRVSPRKAPRNTHGSVAIATETEHPPQELSDFSWDAESPECGVEAGPNIARNIGELNCPMNLDLELQGEALIHRAGASRRQSWLQLDETVPAVPPLRPKRSGPPPLSSAHVLRRAASMASPPTPQYNNNVPVLPVTRSLRFLTEQPTSKAAMGLGFTEVERNALTPSFAQRPALSQPSNLPRATHNPKSFIDLTPEQAVRRESTTRVHRERVKRLLSRASSGFIGWGRSLTGKKNHE
ncbi:hypothetical protein B0H10DRAFT_2294655 [Mycena sp. CBHHK59/15]|nr:hypothetical protein B0H10DRAFT_2294655 [Mycena sp. CBHHK59/15]